MRGISRNTLLLFALPFILLAVVTLRLEGSLRSDKNSVLFAQEVTHKIPVGMPMNRAKEILKSSGFSSGATPSNLNPVGLALVGKVVPSTSSPLQTFGFTKSHAAFPLILNKHIWRVYISVRHGRVQKVQALYHYHRFDA